MNNHLHIGAFFMSEYVELVITDRNALWYQKCDWLDQFEESLDKTDWGMWQLGLSDIVYHVPGDIAVIFYLTFGA